MLEKDLQPKLEAYFEEKGTSTAVSPETGIPFHELEKSKALVASDIKVVLGDPAFKTLVPSARAIAR